MVIELFLIGVGLSMDAFAVSVCKGLGMEKINKKTRISDWIVFRRISGTDAVSRLGTGNPFSEIHYFGRSLDRLFPVAVYRWQDGD